MPTHRPMPQPGNLGRYGKPYYGSTPEGLAAFKQGIDPRMGLGTLASLAAIPNDIYEWARNIEAPNRQKQVAHGIARALGQDVVDYAGDETAENSELIGGLINPANFVNYVKAAKGAGKLGAEAIYRAVNSEGPLAKMLTAGIRPMNAVAWHGSPHLFDKFGKLDDVIGTGQGAQAYGHGLYLAESPEVARAYQNTLSKYGELHFGDGTVKSVLDLPYGSPEQIAGQIWMNKPNLADAKFALGNLDSKYLGAPKEEVLKQLEGLHKANAQLSGSFYKTDIPDEAIPKMLDWDKPLSQQKDIVLNLAKINPDVQWAVDMGALKSIEDGGVWKGKDLYDHLSEQTFIDAGKITRSNKADASKTMLEAGIPGIKYLDGTSRGIGEGTSNYVMFDPAMIRILERNGVPTGLKPWAEDAIPRAIPEAPQAEALRLAQQRAALPVEKGGLGLPVDNTPMDRAKAMGFDTDVLHGGTNDFSQFNGTRPTYATAVPEIADIYANATGRHKALRHINAGPNVMPLTLRGNALEVSDLGEGGGGWLSNNLAAALGVPRTRQQVNALPEHGYDYLKATNMSDLGGDQTQYMIPAASENIRSRFAAFDPWRRTSAIAAAMGVAAPDLLAAENEDATNYAEGGSVLPNKISTVQDLRVIIEQLNEAGYGL